MDKEIIELFNEMRNQNVLLQEQVSSLEIEIDILKEKHSSTVAWGRTIDEKFYKLFKKVIKLEGKKGLLVEE